MNGKLPLFIRQPSALRYRVVTHDGQIYEGILGHEIRKTLEKPAGFSQPVVVYECLHPVSKLWVRLWPDEIRDVQGEPIV